jgi:hypothetical protein
MTLFFPVLGNCWMVLSEEIAAVALVIELSSKKASQPVTF